MINIVTSSIDYDIYSSERNPKPVFNNNAVLQEYYVRF